MPYGPNWGAAINLAPTPYAAGQTRIPFHDYTEQVDVLVVGGGLTGLIAARELARGGIKVFVAEKRQIGDGPSGRSGGQLWPGFECPFSELIATLGAASALRAMALIHQGLTYLHRDVLAHHPTRCDFRPGVVLASRTQDQARWIEAEAALMQTHGLAYAQLLSPDSLKQHLAAKLFLNALQFEGEGDVRYGHLNPWLYVTETARLARQDGALIAENSPVTHVEKLSGGGYQVVMGAHKLVARQMVFATGAERCTPQPLALPRHFMPVQTVILATAPMPAALAAELASKSACFCDARDLGMAYFRFVPQPDGQVRLAYGGADAVAQMQTAWEISKLEREMYEVFPLLRDRNIRVEAVWGGQCDLTRTHRPYMMTQNEGTVYVVGGYAGQGMVASATYGRAVAGKILGRTQDVDDFSFLSSLSPAPYAANSVLAMLQLGAQVLPLMLSEVKQSLKLRART